MSLITTRPLSTIRLAAVALTATVALGLAGCSGSAAPGTSDAQASATTYESEFGPVELPNKIERIVSVDFYTPAALADLGVYPVGVVNSYFTEGAIPEDYASKITENGAESIGEYYEMNLEAVAKTAPDVILATDDFLPLDDPNRTELEKLAPIITFKARDGESWRTRATELASILGKEAEIAPLVEEYNTKRDALKDKYADIIGNYSFTVLVPVEDEWGTYADTHFATPILRDLGVKFREQEADETNEFGFPNWFSYENLDRISNADIILAMPSRAGDFRTQLADNEIWQNLPAVRDGLVFDYIDNSPTGSFGWAIDNLEDLDKLFTQIQTELQGN